MISVTVIQYYVTKTNHKISITNISVIDIINFQIWLLPLIGPKLVTVMGGGGINHRMPRLSNKKKILIYGE